MRWFADPATGPVHLQGPGKSFVLVAVYQADVRVQENGRHDFTISGIKEHSFALAQAIEISWFDQQGCV